VFPFSKKKEQIFFIMQEKRKKKSSIKQRILLFVEHLGISKRDFYKTIGISKGTLESSTGITEDTLVKFITNYPCVNLVWLLTGKGDMLLSDTRSEPENWIVYKDTFSSVRYTSKDLLRVGVRIDEICHNYGITHEQLTEKIGFDYRVLPQIINGKRPAPVILLQEIEKLCPNLNPTWLYCGKGSMHAIDYTSEEYMIEQSYRDNVDAMGAIERDYEQHLTECIAAEELEQKMWEEDEERLQKQVEEWMLQQERENPANKVATSATKEKKQRKSIATTQKKHIK
jgi:DNA-binding Xre family transcriptional regulator